MKASERWENGIPHCEKTERICEFLMKHEECYFRFGGDGDDGEDLAYLLDEFFGADSAAAPPPV